MKRLLMASALACLLAVSVLAGEISTSGAPSPVQDGTTHRTSRISPGQIPTDGTAEEISAAALSAVLTVLSLLS